MSQLGPHGLSHKDYGAFRRDINVTPVGAQSNAESGIVNAGVTGEQQTTQLGPHGLTNIVRQFSPKQAPNQDVSFEITGAEIQGQVNHPNSAHANIYIDEGAIAGDGGSVTSSDAFATGAESAAEAGTATIQIDAPTAITGAQMAAQDGDVNAGSGTFASIVGAESLGQAEAPTLQTDVNVSILTGVANAQGAEVGIDTDSPVSATVTGGEIGADAGTVIAGPIVATNIIGAASQAGAGTVGIEILNINAIVNLNATVDNPTNEEFCQRTGFRQYPGEIQKDGYGELVRPASRDNKHPLDHIRSRGNDRQRGSIAPEQDDRFVGAEIDTVTSDDL